MLFRSLRREYESLDARRRLTLEQEELRQKVLAQVRESYEAIREPGARQAHRKQDYEPQQCEVSADLLFRQGEMLAVKGQWPQVVENFERAAELMPGVKRYRDGAAQARTGSYKSTASADDDG